MKKILGVSLSDSTIEAVELEKIVGHYEIRAFSRIRVKPSVMENGAVKNLDAFTKHLQSLFQYGKPKAFEATSVALSLPDNIGFTHLLEVKKKLSDQELRDAVANAMADLSVYPLYDLYWNYRRVGSSNKSDYVLWVGGLRKNIDDYVAAFKKAGYEVAWVELESMAAARSIVGKLNKEESVMVLDLGARNVNISISDYRGLMSAYSKAGGGDDITEQIASVAKVPIEKAEEMKLETVVTKIKKNDKAGVIVQKELQKLVEEIKKNIKYYEQVESAKIDKILLTGGGSGLPELSDYLSEALGVPTVKGEPAVKLAGLRNIFNLYSVALGLALLGDRSFSDESLNLSPSVAIQTEKQQDVALQDRRRKFLMVGASLVLVVAVLGGAYIFRVKARQAQEAKFAGYQKPQAAVSALEIVNVDFEMPIRSGDEAAANSGFLLGRFVSGELERTEAFGVTGQKIIAEQVVSVLSADDLTRAENRLLKKIEYDFLIKELEKTAAEEMLLSNAASMELLDSLTTVAVGAVVNTFNYTVRARVVGLYLRESDVNAEIQKRLLESLGAGQDLSVYEIGVPELAVVSYDKESSSAVLRVKVAARLKK